jgi:hypothetical protein
MLTNIVMLCHDRYALTKQAVASIRTNTNPAAYTLTLVDDNSQDFRTRNFLRDQVLYFPQNTTLVSVVGGKHVLGALKNLGVRHSELTFGRGDWLCVLDCDVCVFPGWLDRLTKPEPEGAVILGGCRHPYHAINVDHGDWVETDAVAGYCQVMSWLLWDQVGPYDANASGTGQSEDYSICRRAVACGEEWWVGYVHPPVLTHTGITDSNGNPVTGADQFERIEGVLYL